MSLNHSPSVVTNGLVLYTDMSNTQKSWRGAPTTNLHPLDGYYTWPTQTLHFWNGISWTISSTYTDPGVPGPAGTYLGQVRKYTSGALSASWSGNSYAYILKTAPMTAGQSYAMSAYTFLSVNCNINGMFSSIEGASVAALSGGYVTEYDMSQKGSWQRQGLQGTASGNVNFIIAYPARYGITDGSFAGFILVGGAQVEFGTFPTPYTDTSRSNTQAILDLTNNSTITANSLTYASNGTFSFNGSNNFLSISSSGIVENSISVDIWFNVNSTKTYAALLGSNVTEKYEMLIKSASNLEISLAPGNYIQHNNILSINTWVNIVVSASTGTAWKVYKNGVDLGTPPIIAGTYQVSGTGVSSIDQGRIRSDLSSFAFSGNIGSTKIYNRALSAAEVQQNFNALRSRYGI